MHIKEKGTLHQHNLISDEYIFQTDEPDNLYSKTSLYFRNEEVASKKRNCFNTKKKLDFRKKQDFKIDGESLDDFHIKVEIKRGSNILHKSK